MKIVGIRRAVGHLTGGAREMDAQECLFGGLLAGIKCRLQE